jgi:hypothetical protein
MSSETIAWAKEQVCGNPVTKAVLMEIANWARPNGVCEYLSIRRIAEVVEVSVRTVQRHIALLESPDLTRGGLGLIRRIERYREDGGRAANCFELVGYQPPLSLIVRPRGNPTPPHDKLSPPPDKLTGAPLTNCHPPHDTGVRGENINLNINISPPSPYGDGPPLEQRARRKLEPDWRPDERLIEWAKEKAPHVDLDTETERFREFFIHIRPDRRSAEGWRASWRNWMLRACRDYRRPPAAGGARAERTSQRNAAIIRDALADRTAPDVECRDRQNLVLCLIEGGGNTTDGTA